MSIDVNVQNDLVIVTETTEDIVVNVSNAAGPQGPAGAAGVGVPVGGSTGQVLKKFSATNYDTYWAEDASGLTSVGLSVPTGLTVTNSPLTTNGSIAVGLASGYSIPTTASQATWNTAYNDSIVSAGVTGTTTKTLTLNQQDGGTVTASWTDENTDAVTSVFGRTGAVVATEGDYTLTQLGDVTLTSPTNGQVLKYNGTTWVNNTDTDTGLTSVGLSMPSAFAVANSPLTSNGTLSVTGAGLATQYIRGDGQLATFPSTASGGSSVNYYLNGSVNSSVAGYKQLDNSAIIGGGTDFTLSGNGLIAQFLTDVGNPNRVQIPGGAWNFEMYFNSSSNGGSEAFYIELHKYDGTTFTLLSTSSATPETITSGTSIDLYLTSLAVPTTALLTSDRLAIRIYIVNNAGARTVTLHTENNTLCEIITTFAGGISALNGLSANTQYLATGTSGTDFAISSATDTHTFNLPIASGTNTGKLSNTDWTTFNSKQNAITLTTTGTSGASTLVGSTLNIPQYADQFVGTVTSVAALTLGTTGTDISSTVANGTTTPVITLNVPTASATNRGVLSSADWTIFNNKVGGSGTINYLPKFTSASTIGNSLIYESSGVVNVGGQINITTGQALTLGLQNLQLPTGVASTISAGLSVRTGVANESIIQFGNNLNAYYTGLVDASRAGAMIRLDTRGVAPIPGASAYSVFQIQTRAAGVADPNYTVPVQIAAAPSGSFCIDINGYGYFYNRLRIGNTTTAPTEALSVTGNGVFSSNVTAASLIKSGGTSSQFLKADGSVDSTTYQPLLTNPVTGTGTTNYLPKWTSGSAIGNSIITDSGSIVTIGGALTVSVANINLSNNYNLTGRNAANTLNLPLIGRNGSDRIDIDVDSYGTTIGGTGTIVLNATGGNVGIGTASPAYKLDVNRSSLGAIAQFITLDGTYNPRLLINGTSEGIQLFATYSSGAEALMFGTANTERMRLTSNLIIGSTTDNGNRLQVTGNGYFSGNVGIGETTPLYPIHITSSTNARVFIKGTTNFTSTQIANNSGSLFLMIDDSTGSQTSEVYSRAISSTGVTPLLFILNGSEKMRLDSSGNLGLGVTPSAWLNTFKVLQVGTAAVSQIANRAYLTANWFYDTNDKYIATDFATMYRQQNGEHHFLTAPSGTAGNAISFTQAMTLTSGGNLLVGTTTDTGERLQISGTMKVTGAATFSSDVTVSGVLQETVTTNRQTASYTLALTDRGKLVEMNVATANNLTVPLNSSVAFAIGTKIDLAQYGAGQTTVVATSGVTVRSAGGALKLAVQYSGASLVKIGTNEWYLFGDITV